MNPENCVVCVKCGRSIEGSMVVRVATENSEADKWAWHVECYPEPTDDWPILARTTFS